MERGVKRGRNRERSDGRQACSGKEQRERVRERAKRERQENGQSELE